MALAASLQELAEWLVIEHIVLEAIVLSEVVVIEEQQLANEQVDIEEPSWDFVNRRQVVTLLVGLRVISRIEHSITTATWESYQVTTSEEQVIVVRVRV